MRNPHAPSRLLAFALAAVVLLVGACGTDDDGPDPGSANPRSAASQAEFEQALADAPPKLAALYRHGDALLDGGADAFESRINSLRGFPVVVNKWASWCGPCRFEFPFFQAEALESGDRVAFIGVNSKDSEDAAQTFLDELPLPYPSYSDPDHEIGDLFESRAFPVTAFYDAQGNLAYVHQGQYASQDDLAADVDEYAR